MSDLINRQDAINAIKKLRGVSEWIPVSEKLPPEDSEVLITIEDGTETYMGTSTVRQTFKANYSTESGVEHSYEVEGPEAFYYNEEVVAWMPLPEPYKEDPNDTE